MQPLAFSLHFLPRPPLAAVIRILKFVLSLIHAFRFAFVTFLSLFAWQVPLLLFPLGYTRHMINFHNYSSVFCLGLELVAGDHLMGLRVVEWMELGLIAFLVGCSSWSGELEEIFDWSVGVKL